MFERINHTITLTERGHELVSYDHQIRALTDEFKEKPNKGDLIITLDCHSYHKDYIIAKEEQLPIRFGHTPPDSLSCANR